MNPGRNRKGGICMPQDRFTVKAIGHIRTDFPTKFGVPRQSGLIPNLQAKIVLTGEFAQPEAVRGLEEYSHLWLLWRFSKVPEDYWAATVRPPRLGGNVRVGVFASRSPFRPNSIGLSSVKIEKIEAETPEGPVIYVSGADLMDGTPILDIKPYLAYVDSHPEARDGFAGRVQYLRVDVDFPASLLAQIPENKRQTLLAVLAENPAPHYQKDPQRIYGFGFAGKEIKFKIVGNQLTVVDVLDAVEV